MKVCGWKLILKHRNETVTDLATAEDIPSPPDPGRWEHELYFVSHMFKRDWAVGYQTFNFMDE